METAIIINTVLIILFSILAVYDGLYLHIFKYRLHNHTESRTEHFTHTLRAIFFPAILYFLFLQQDCQISFIIGIVAVILDLLVLGIDAYIEKDSRKFMGGLPRWEYILHLFVNGFHFASIAVFLSLKLKYGNDGIIIIPSIAEYQNSKLFHTVIGNLLPGATIIAIVHIFLCFSKTRLYWENLRQNIRCC